MYSYSLWIAFGLQWVPCGVLVDRFCVTQACIECFLGFCCLGGVTITLSLAFVLCFMLRFVKPALLGLMVCIYLGVRVVVLDCCLCLLYFSVLY